MRKIMLTFLKRGMIACGIGPIILAIVYIILEQTGEINALTIKQVCIGIFSLSILAFVAGGLNAIYQIEKIPFMLAVLIHGIVLYIFYLATYLVNNWIQFSVIPIVVFSIIFVLGYITIWGITYCIIKKSTSDINEKLRKKNQNV